MKDINLLLRRASTVTVNMFNLFNVMPALL